MNRFKHLPIYAGFVTLILAVLVSSVQIGTKGQLTSTTIQARQAQAYLSLRYSEPDMVSVIVSSGKEIAGVDVVIAFEKDKVQILPSTLTPGPKFSTTGAVISDNPSVFSFSAVPVSIGVIDGIVAQFRLADLSDLGNVTTTLTIDTHPDASAVLDKATLDTIPTTSSPLTFTMGMQ